MLRSMHPNKYDINIPEIIELTMKRATNSFFVKYKINAIIKFKMTTSGISIKIPIEMLGSGFTCLTHIQIITKSIIVNKITLIKNFIFLTNLVSFGSYKLLIKVLRFCVHPGFQSRNTLLLLKIK